MAARNLASRAVTVEDVPPATLAFIRRQATVRGLEDDPLAGATHGLRTDEEILDRQRSSGPRQERLTVEMLLTPELLVISYRQGRDDVAEVSAGATVTFHRLDQLEVAEPPMSGGRRRVLGASPSAPEGVLPLVSMPIGGVRRTTRQVPVGSGPEVTTFRDALVAAVQRAGARPAPPR